MSLQNTGCACMMMMLAQLAVVLLLAAAATAVTAQKGYPVTIENCGLKYTYTSTPGRAVTLHQVNDD